MKCIKCGVGVLMWANPFKTMPNEVICDKCKATMNKEIQSGNWCRPKSVQARKAIYELGNNLGLDGYLQSGTIDNGRGQFVSFKIGPAHDDLEMPVPEFIAAMYEEAERRKADVVVKPPIGIIPKWAHAESRLRDIDAAIDRYRKDGATIPPEWGVERDGIVDYLWKRKHGLDAEQQAIIMQPLVDLANTVLGMEGADSSQLVGVKELVVNGPEMKKVLEDMSRKPNRVMLDDHEQRIKALEKLPSLVEYHNRQVDRLDSHMIEVEKRLGDSTAACQNDVINVMLQYRNDSDRRIEALEKALDEHLRKEMEVSLSDLDLVKIIRQRKVELVKVQRYADAKLFRDAERAIIEAANIPAHELEQQ